MKITEVKEVVDALADMDRNVMPGKNLIERVFTEWVRDRCTPTFAGPKLQLDERGHPRQF